MDYSIIDNINYLTIKVSGDIEMQSIRSLKDEVLKRMAASDVDIVVDLAATEYIDSTGIGFFLTLLKLQRQKGRMLRIINASPRITGLLRLSSLADMVH